MFDLRFGIWTSQSKQWDETLAEWQQIERLGFDCAGVVDHFMPTGGSEDSEFYEGWTLLTALATLVPRLRVAILVSGNTYRNPVLLAKQAVTLDQITGGRVDLGIGAGWYVREHEAYGWELHHPGQRVDKLREALQIIEMLQLQDRSTFSGNFYTLDEAPFEPKAYQPGGIPIMIGAQKPRMLRLVAEFADIWNINHGPAAMESIGAELNKICREIGRDPASIRWSAFAFRSVLDRDPFENVEAFRQVTEQYLNAGASEIYYRYPETESGVEVLQQTAELLDEYRSTFRSISA